MAGVTTADGWTTYSPPEEVLAVSQIAGALDAVVYDCRLFARLAREARLNDLPTRLHLTWEAFCEERLRHPAATVEAMIAGIEVLGETVPVPAETAERVGRTILTNTERARLGGIAGGRSRKRIASSSDNEAVEREQRGTDPSYLLARLDRDHPALAARVRAGELKPKTAARLAGIVKPRAPLDDLRRAWAKASVDERVAFLAEVTA